MLAYFPLWDWTLPQPEEELCLVFLKRPDRVFIFYPDFPLSHMKVLL